MVVFPAPSGGMPFFLHHFPTLILLGFANPAARLIVFLHSESWAPRLMLIARPRDSPLHQAEIPAFLSLRLINCHAHKCGNNHVYDARLS